MVFSVAFVPYFGHKIVRNSQLFSGYSTMEVRQLKLLFICLSLRRQCNNSNESLVFVEGFYVKGLITYFCNGKIFFFCKSTKFMKKTFVHSVSSYESFIVFVK